MYGGDSGHDRAINKIISENHETLIALKLGQERLLLHEYLRQKTVLGATKDTSLEKHLPMETASTVPFANLKCLEAFGLDVASKEAGSLQHRLNFSQLSRLVLESCPGSKELLSSLARSSESLLSQTQGALNLKEFVFRYENPTPVIVEALAGFLKSFSGLELLSVLLDRVSKMLHPACFLSTHGRSLKILVWEGKTALTTDLSEVTSLTLGDGRLGNAAIANICEQCPNLVELAIPYCWDYNSLDVSSL